jgi:hypothetical protein
VVAHRVLRVSTVGCHLTRVDLGAPVPPHGKWLQRKI